MQADVKVPGRYDISLQNTSGVTVRRKRQEFSGPGRKTFHWSLGDDLAPGIYFLVMQGEDGRQVRKVIRR